MDHEAKPTKPLPKHLTQLFLIRLKLTYAYPRTAPATKSIDQLYREGASIEPADETSEREPEPGPELEPEPKPE